MSGARSRRVLPAREVREAQAVRAALVAALAERPADETVYADEPPPCTGCASAGRCADQHLACEAFSAYCAWRSPEGASRKPTREQFLKIFGAAP